MKSKSAQIYVFSGSGNTLLLAEAIATIFNANNKPTILRKIPGSFFSLPDDCALGLAVTTAWFSTYPFVIDFIKNLPEGNNREVFFITSMAGSTFGMDNPIREVLEKKGYKTIGNINIKMPSNYGRSLDAKSVANQAVITDGIKKASNFAGSLLTDQAQWKKSFSPLSSFFFKLAQSKWPWLIFRKMFPLHLNQEICISCNICRELCPTNSIAQNDSGLFIEKTCVSCQHCASFCPVNAISLKGETEISYKPLTYDHFKKLFTEKE